MTGVAPVTLVTGSAGEIGAALVRELVGRGERVVTVDLQPGRKGSGAVAHFEGDITDPALWTALGARYRPRTTFHLAAVLSTHAERTPTLAHRVNVEGTARLLRFVRSAGSEASPARFLFPSSIAVYGFPSRAGKAAAGAVREDEHLDPTTLYGQQKLYIERLGAALERERPGLDFRVVRFAGLISCDTLPSGGTSDWAPELLHAAARGEPCAFFVRGDARLPFCAMPDAVRGLVQLADSERADLRRTSYNLGGPSFSADEIIARVRRDFPDVRVELALDEERDRIVASWPGDVDDRAARRDFGWAPAHGRESLFSRYLIPGIRARYRRTRAVREN